MANKPKETFYTEARNIAEYVRRGKFKLRAEYVPGIAAWILMLARRQAKARESLANKLVTDAVPGMEEAIASLDKSLEVLAMLMRLLPENFGWQDWNPAVADINEMLGVVIGGGPLQEVPDVNLETILPVPTDGGDESGIGTDAAVCRKSGEDKPGERSTAKRRRPKRDS